MGESNSAFQFPDLKTARLFLRVLTLDDAESVYRHFSDDDVTRFMDICSCTRPQEARDIIAFHLNDSGCRWGIFDKTTGVLVGTCGYHCWARDETTSKAEIGFDLSKAHWGQGFMKEVLKAVIPIGFKQMHLVKIFASVEPENHRSIRLLNNLRFQPEPALRDGLLWFNLFKDDWNMCDATRQDNGR